MSSCHIGVAMKKLLVILITASSIMGCTRNEIKIGYESGVGSCSSDVQVTDAGFVATSSCADSSNVRFKVSK